MSDDETLRRGSLKLMQDRFAGKAMKSVAVDAQRLQIPGNRQHAHDIGHRGVKRSVEARHLRKSHFEEKS